MRQPRFSAMLPGLAALIAGLLLATGLPPLHIVIAPLAFAALLTIIERSHSAGGAFVCGWLFGLGFFLAGLYWIGIAFYTDAERFGALAVPAVVLLSAFLALTSGICTLILYKLGWRSTLARALALAAFWTVGELIRGSYGFQFPWNPVASIWGIMDVMMQPIAWIGPHLLGLLTVFAGASLASLATVKHRRSRILPVFAIGLLVCLGAGGFLRLEWAVDTGPRGDDPTRIRIVQANIDQHHKWDADKVNQWFFSHVELSDLGEGPPPDVVIWPESSVPFRLEHIETRQAITDRVGFDATFLMGSDHVLREEGSLTLHNSLYVMEESGELGERYDKVDLVPFGEFLPFRPILTALGLEKLTPGSSDFLSGPGRRTLHVDGIPSFSPLVCYEAIFPGVASADDDRPDWLVNVTNDAWFGNSSGPYQHLVMARMRAIEEGLPLVRAANTGISAVTDAFGVIEQGLPLGTTGVIDADLPEPLPEPPLFRRAPMTITLGGIVLALFVAWASSRRASRT